MSDTMGVYENNALKFSQACLAILGSSPFVYPFSLSLAREAENQTSVIAKKRDEKVDNKTVFCASLHVAGLFEYIFST